MMKYLNKAMRGLISCVGNPYPLFAMATQSHLSTQPYFFFYTFVMQRYEIILN
jgi:hypothetical protein